MRARSWAKFVSAALEEDRPFFPEVREAKLSRRESLLN